MKKTGSTILFFVIIVLVNAANTGVYAAAMHNNEATLEKEMGAAEYELPADVMSYLKTHRAPVQVTCKLDHIFSDPVTQKRISAIYSDDKRDAREARENLQEQGWKFFKSFSHYVCCPPALTGYVLKMPRLAQLDCELLNAGRIKYGEMFQKKLKEKNLSCRVSCETAYFMPLPTKKNVILPKIVVIAKEVEGSAKFDAKQLEEFKQMKQLGYPDTLPGNNIINTATGLELVDLEPHGVPLVYNDVIGQAKL